MPDKTSYDIGDSFDPAGMTVIAHYSNGTSRDVTDYVTYSRDPLTEDDSEFEIRFEHVMYQNSGGETGVPYDAPSAVITLNVGSAQAVPGDINGNGFVDEQDVTFLIGHVIGTDYLTEQAQRAAADMNNDTFIDEQDVTLLIQVLLE